MKETYHHITHLTGSLLAVVFATFTLLACHEEQQLLTVPESATLKLTLGAPHMSVATRGISDDPENTNGEWTSEELLVDGRILKELALLLLDGNTLVGTKNFSYADNATVTQDATFKGLVAGKSYRLIAIANYSGLSNFPVITGLSVNTDISTTLNSLYDYTLDAGGDFVVTPQKQPLTLVQDITMPASGGTYEVSGELVRTFARLRIEVATKSDINDLTINGLSFNTPFAQQNAYLLTHPEDIDRNFAGFTKGMPTVTSTDALTQYVEGTTVSKGNNSKVLFDGYILESRNGDDGYHYTLDVEYKGASTIVSTIVDVDYTFIENVTYSTLNDIKSNYSSYCFIIRNTRQNKDIYVDSRNLIYQQSSLSSIYSDLKNNQNILWKLKKAPGDDNNFYLYNIGKEKYAGKAPVSGYGSPAFPTTEAPDVHFTLEDAAAGIAMGASEYDDSDGTKRFMNDKDGEYISSWTQGDPGSGFYFYPVQQDVTTEDVVYPAQYDTPITLRTIDAVSGVASDATQISRNDFINVLVNVAYNENTGTMEFYVEDWEKVDIDVPSFE